jgi:microcystin-dependent protein
MADPTPYSRSYSFSGFQTVSPSAPLPGQQVDTQFDAVAAALSDAITALKDIRRSDGKLQSGLISTDQLAAVFSVGFTLRGVWVSGTAYSSGDGVVYGAAFYKAKSFIASSTTTPDVDTTNWQFLTSLLGPVPADGSLTNAKFANAPAQSIKGNATGSLGAVADLTGTQVAGLLPVLRYDAAQSLSAAQQLQVRLNLAAPPVGTILDFAGATLPGGFLWAAGQAVDRTTYALLFAALGTTYGTGNGSTTFNVPDLRGRVAAGRDNLNGTAASRLTSGNAGFDGTALGAGGGDERMQNHTHYMPNGGSGASWMPTGIGTPQVNGAYATTSAGLGNSQNVQPTIVVNKIIFAGV